MVRHKGKSKTRKFSVPKRLSVLLLSILLLAIPITIYFTRYITTQKSYFTNRNFRHLANISRQIEQRISAFRAVVKNAAADTLKQQAENAKDAGAKVSPDQNFKEFLARSGRLVGESVPTLPNLKMDAGRDPKNLQVRVTRSSEGETSSLNFICTIRHRPEETEYDKKEMRFEAKIDLREVVKPVVGQPKDASLRASETDDGFDAILIVSLDEQHPKIGSEEKGPLSTTIYQEGAPELDIDSLDNLTRADATDKTIEFSTLSRSTSLADVRLADADYRMYLQPLELADDSEDQPDVQAVSKTTAAAQNEVAGSRWVMCGLVEAGHFRRQTWAFPYPMLITVAVFTTLVALSWPFLKLLFIGPKDRLRLSDVYFTAFALLIGSAMLTLFILFGITYARSEDQLDHQLQKFSTEIEIHFQQEVQSAGDELKQLSATAQPALDSINEALETTPSKRRETELSLLSQNCDRKHILDKPRVGPYSLSQNCSRKHLDEPNLDAYPYFHRATWSDNAGTMRLQWTIDAHTSYLPVDTKDFFKRIMEGRTRGGGEFWLEPTISRYTGDKVAIVSKPVYAADKKTISNVAALDIGPLSLMHTVVPAGFGYRIIDNSGIDPADDDNAKPGKVLFQSSESQEVGENFFEECDNDHSLRSRVFGRNEDFVDVNYRGEGHRLYIKPIKGFPNWSLVVFRNKQPLRTVYLEMLTLAGFIFLSYAVILLILFIIIYFVKTRTSERTEWIWPSEAMSGMYRQIFIANLILILLSIFVILKFDHEPALVGISLIAFAAIFIFAFALKLSWPLKGLHRAAGSFGINRLLDKGDAYTRNVFAILLLTGILPAVAFYKVAYNEEMRLFVKHAQITIAQGLKDRDARIRSQYSTYRADPAHNPRPLADPQAAKTFIEQRLRYRLGGSDRLADVYAHFFFGTVIQDGATEKPKEQDRSLLAWLNNFVPFFNDTSIEMGGLAKKADDDSWCWEPSTDNLTLHYIIHHASETGQPQGTSPAAERATDVHIQTPLQFAGAFPLQLYPLGWFLICVWTSGLLTVLILLYYLTRLVLRKVFLLEVTETLYPQRLTDNESSLAHLFVIQTGGSAYSNGFAPADQFHNIDLTREAPGNGWVEGLTSRIAGEAGLRKIVISHFENQLSDAAVNNQKLQLVESLLAARKTVVIMSSVEPSAYTFDQAVPPAGEPQSDGASERWARAMTHFKRVYAVQDEAALIERSLLSLIASLDSAPALSAQRRSRILELAQFVWDECSHLPVLQDIGRQIVEQLKIEDLDENQIMSQIFDRAELYYREIWLRCAEAQQLTLLHLAEDRLLSPHDPDIRLLLQRGLILCAPDIRIMNETFKRFVLSQTVVGELKSAEARARKSSHWEAFKVPLFVGFIGVVVFLLLTQRDLYSSSWTLITAATTGIPAVFKLFSLFHGGSGPEGINT